MCGQQQTEFEHGNECEDECEYAADGMSASASTSALPLPVPLR